MKRKSEIKKLLIFVLVCLACAVVGMFLGRLAGRNEDSIVEVWESVLINVRKVLPVTYAVIFAVMTSLSFLLYGRTRKLEKSLDGSDSDDEKLDKMEEIVSYPILISNLMLIVSIFLFTASMDTALFTDFGDAKSGFYFTFPTIIFFLSLVFAIWVQRLSVELEKRQHTEKTASVFDFNFNAKWLEECDEAERMKTYKTGYDGFKAMNLTCLILWLVALMASLTFKTGVFPIFIICVIWGVGVTASAVSGAKLEKHGLDKK